MSQDNNVEADSMPDGYLPFPEAKEPLPTPTRKSKPEEFVADHLDYLHHEAFFVVSPTFEVTAYRTLWFGLQYDSETVEQGETVGNGALATVRWYDGEPVGDGHLQGQFAALKDVGDVRNFRTWWEEILAQVELVADDHATNLTRSPTVTGPSRDDTPGMTNPMSTEAVTADLQKKRVPDPKRQSWTEIFAMRVP